MSAGDHVGDWTWEPAPDTASVAGGLRGTLAVVRRIELSGPLGVRWVPDEQRGAGVLVLAGSSGRVDEARARLIADEGCITESIQWFGGPDQNPGPWEIPVETFQRRIADLTRDCATVYIVGTSFGAEAALVTAAHSPEVDGVAAFAPSDVVWAGIDAIGRQTSHWSLDGYLLPFIERIPAVTCVTGHDDQVWPSDLLPRTSAPAELRMGCIPR